MFIDRLFSCIIPSKAGINQNTMSTNRFHIVIAVLILLLITCSQLRAGHYLVDEHSECSILDEVFLSTDDKPDYRLPGYGHGSWEKTVVASEIFKRDGSSHFWMRIPLLLEKTPSRDLALFLPQTTGQVELFLNGAPVYPQNRYGPDSLNSLAVVQLPKTFFTEGVNILAMRLGFTGVSVSVFGPLYIGEYGRIMSRYSAYIVKYTSFFFSCLALAIFIFVVFIKRIKDKYYVYFSLLALSVGLWTAGIKGLPLLLFNHRMVFILSSHAAALLIVIFELLFVRSFISALRTSRLFAAMLLFYTFMLVFLLGEILVSGNVNLFYTYLYQPFMLSLVLSQIAILAVLGKQILLKTAYARPMFAGVFCIALPGSMMFLYYLEESLIPFEPPIIEGFIAMVVIFASVLASRYARAFTQLENANNELVLLDKLKDDFLAITSHELRTPLAGIIGLTDTIEKAEMNADNSTAVDLIKQSAEHLSMLVSDILDFSKLNAGRADLFISQFDLSATIQTVVSLLGPSAREKSLTLETEIDEAIRMLNADQRRVRQILINLIGNAIKFTDSGHVRIRACPDNGTVRISVIDTGCGIDSNTMKKLFVPFVQGGDIGSLKSKGSGLGLAISRRIAELHGGTIAVSPNLPRGSVFTLVLPETPVKLKINKHVRAETDTTPLSGINDRILRDVNDCVLQSGLIAEKQLLQKNTRYSAHILVVDDDPINLWAISSLCRKNGYTVSTAKNGDEALSVVENEPVELVLLDLMLPGMSGFEVCERLRERYADRFIPVIIMTAHGDGSSEMIRGFQSGANDYLVKPFDMNVLMMRVENQLAIKHMLDMEKTIVNGLRYESDQVTNIAQRSAILRDFALQMSEWEGIIREDLDIASQFQTKLMNKASIKGLDFFLFYKPILRIGGDVYDIIEISPGVVRVFLADATGHGINASLNTVKILSEYSAIKNKFSSPSEIITHMNLLFHKTFVEYQIIFTCVVADMDLNASTLNVAMAGHIEQIIITPQGPQPLKLRGPIIGLKEDSVYEQRSYEFPKGSALILFSDGIFDFFESDDPFWETLSLFSTEMIKPIKDGNFNTAACIGNHVLPEEKRACPEILHDDITLLVLRNE